MATPPAAQNRDLEQRLRDLERNVAEVVGATLRRQPNRSQALQYDLNSTALATGFTEVTSARQTIAIPAGYSRAAVLLFVSAGATVTAQGNVGVQPLITRAGATAGGPPISNGSPGAGSVSVASFVAVNLANLGAGGETSFVLSLSAYAASSGSVNAGSANVHLSAVVNFYR